MKFTKKLSLFLAFLLLFSCVSAMTAGAETYLDLESSATYSNSAAVTQNYVLTVSDTQYNDVTKVKLSWSITDLSVSYKEQKTWNPDTLSWDTGTPIENISAPAATFTLTNYSSVKIAGTVSFEVESALATTYDSASTTFTNNGATIDTVVQSDHSIIANALSNLPTNTITANLAFVSGEFAKLSATSGSVKYGTYTVTVSTPAN